AARSAAESAARSAAESAAGLALIEFTGNAIDRWRELARCDQPVDIDPAAVDDALVRIAGAR
ncbi:hypothetical protein, partial [Gordonia sp. (in: high G+C Gram-positive bacteria)]|uniref:hypothetical protein n=1 Tax=Gordonia sp. (in: high G+C Gram-positive bacteria) TaxID=84139 RepID=UPI0039E5E308